MFNAIYGPDGRDETVVDAPFDVEPRHAAVEAAESGIVESRVRIARPGRGGGGGRGGRGRPEDARRRAEERNKLLKDALDVSARPARSSSR